MIATPRLLLLYPPLASVQAPPLAPAVLAAHLRSRALTVDVADLNLAFYRDLLAPARLAAAHAFAEQRLSELLAVAARDGAQEVELAFLLRAWKQAEPVLDRLPGFLDSAAGLRSDERERLMRAASLLASVPHFPERAEFSGALAFFLAPFDHEDPADLRRAADSDGIFGDFFARILPPLFEKEPYDIVGFSVGFSQQLVPALRCARALRRLAPRVHITVGGAALPALRHCLAFPQLFELADSFVDGAGELPLECLAREIASPSPDLSRVPGLVRLHQGAVERQPPAPQPAADERLAPALESFDLGAYPLSRDEMWLPLSLSRGCRWARCAFCSPARVEEQASPTAERAHEWLRTVTERTGIPRVSLTDEEAPPGLLGALSRRLVETDSRILWSAMQRLTPGLTPERCRLYHAAGCRLLLLGLESVEDRILTLMRKGMTFGLAQQALANLHAAGIGVHVFMMVGFPTETEEEARRGFVRLLECVGLGWVRSYSYSPFLLLPGSAVAHDPAHFGVRLRADDDPNRVRHEIDCEGMDRVTARRLAREFNAFPRAWQPLPRDPVRISGREFSLGERASRLEVLLDQAEADPARFGQWLAHGAASCTGRERSIG